WPLSSIALAMGSVLLWEQALEDLKTAEVLVEVKRYYASVFFSQQAAEKALKALYIEVKRLE
ncbi:HEPN domain-containing protein, partial [Proteus mirabilis]|uniref:HEPN domain-containing protein n=1 Tax=Proteus mirabilis TaxID=584 RepID=UPI001952C3F6